MNYKVSYNEKNYNSDEKEKGFKIYFFTENEEIIFYNFEKLSEWEIWYTCGTANFHQKHRLMSYFSLFLELNPSSVRKNRPQKLQIYQSMDIMIYIQKNENKRKYSQISSDFIILKFM